MGVSACHGAGAATAEQAPEDHHQGRGSVVPQGQHQHHGLLQGGSQEASRLAGFHVG